MLLTVIFNCSETPVAKGEQITATKMQRVPLTKTINLKQNKQKRKDIFTNNTFSV